MKLNQEYSPQELNGITDWFQDAVDYTSDKVSDAALWVTEKTGTTEDVLAVTEDIDKELGKLSASYKAKIDEFRTMMAKLLKTQEKVDEAIESLPEGPEKQKLVAKRDKSRGTFSMYILPAWKKFQEWVGGSDYAGMGFAVTGTMIATAGAVVAAVSIALPYIYSNYKLEQQILADPALRSQYVASRGGWASAFAPELKWAIIGVGGLFLLSKAVPFLYSDVKTGGKKLGSKAISAGKKAAAKLEKKFG